MLDFDGEDARKAAQSTRVVADVMDELADSGDTLDFLGKFIFILLTLHSRILELRIRLEKTNSCRFCS